MKTKKCYNIQNSRKKCKKTKRQKIIPCVEKNMGGQLNNFTNVQVQNCKLMCGKKISKSTKEYEVYSLLNRKYNFPKHILQLKRFISKFYKKETCSHNNNDYFVLENLKNSVGNNVQTLDIKIGYNTALAFESNMIRSKRHYIIDNYLSHSSKRGYRIEGLTGYNSAKIMKNIKTRSMLSVGDRKKYNLYKADLSYILSEFFTNRQERIKCLTELKKINKLFVIPNYNAHINGKESVSFIGSSILIIKGSKKTIVRLIDLNHPVWKRIKQYSKEEEHKSLINFTHGVQSLINDFVN
jgi:hypothetical protein